MAWLVPVALFWTLGALWLGGAALRIEGGRGIQHLLGLLLTFGLYLGTWALARGVLLGAVGEVGSVAIAVVLATVLIPVLAWLGFRVAGVRIRRLPSSA